MSENKQQKMRIVVDDDNGYIEIHADGSVFKLDLDERGVPQFPESVKQQLRPYMSQVVRLKLKMIRTHGVRNGDYIEHTAWCAESRRIGRCDCYPELYTCAGGPPKTLTCVLCNASSTGEIVDGLEIYGDSPEGWQILWTNPRDKFYYCFPEKICNDCIEMLLDNVDIEFVDNPESSMTAIPEHE